MSDTTKQFVKDLRKLADLYEKHPEMEAPYLGTQYAFVRDRAALIATAKELAYLKPKKSYGGDYFMLEIPIGPNVTLAYAIDRQKICERIQVGTKIVEVAAQPAIEAHTKEVPQYEWKCTEALLSSEA